MLFFVYIYLYIHIFIYTHLHICSYTYILIIHAVLLYFNLLNYSSLEYLIMNHSKCKIYAPHFFLLYMFSITSTFKTEQDPVGYYAQS